MCLLLLNKQELAHKLRIENRKYWSAIIGGEQLLPWGTVALCIGRAARRRGRLEGGKASHLTCHF